jgi:hypothetical protein
MVREKDNAAQHGVAAGTATWPRQLGPTGNVRFRRQGKFQLRDWSKCRLSTTSSALELGRYSRSWPDPAPSNPAGSALSPGRGSPDVDGESSMDQVQKSRERSPYDPAPRQDPAAAWASPP